MPTQLVEKLEKNSEHGYRPNIIIMFTVFVQFCLNCKQKINIKINKEMEESST